MEQEHHQLSLLELQPLVERSIDCETEELVEWLLKQASEQRLEPHLLLIRLRVKDLIESYLSRAPSAHRWQFMAHLIDELEHLDHG